jgi:hypothetical protein
MDLRQEEIREFREKMNKLFKELRKVGLVCRKNFSCCQTCGHTEMPADTSYVFYHRQEAESLREGSEECYLAHSIRPEHQERVKVILQKYGSIWNGDPYSTIVIPFRKS